jgi:CheY-like chemotaxis protein
LGTPDPVNILVVDDERPIQRMLADALAQQGFSVTVERDGEWALKAFEMKPFDAVLLDLLLPAINGYEVARKIRESPQGQGTPLIMMSGVYKSAAQKQEALDRYGAFAFLEKPFKLSQLFEILQQALGPRYPNTVVGQPPVQQAAEATPSENLADRTAQEEASLVESQSRGAPSVSSVRGDFQKKPFPEVLAEIYRWKGSGALLLRREKVKKIVFFREGMPQYVKSNLLSECLGRIMVKERMISEAECEESLKRMKSSGRQQGTVLIDMGCISPHNLNYALNLQLRAKLFDVFSWQSGDYQFDKRAALPAEVINLDMSTAAVIYEGVRRAYDEQRLAAELGHGVEHLFVHPSSDPLYALQDVGLGEEEQLLLEAADGRKTVATLRALNLLIPLETDRLLYAMKCAQVIELKDKPAEGKPAVPIQFRALPPVPRTPPPPPPASQAMGQPPPLRQSSPARPLPPGLLPELDARGDHSPPPPQPPQPRGAKPPPLPPTPPTRMPLLPELSPPTDPHGLGGDEALVRERLAARVAALRKMDLFEILGVPRNATDDQLAQAYLTLARENHPDKLFGYASAEIRQLASQIYELITYAHTILLDPEEKAKYIQEMERGIKREVGGGDVGKILTAEGKFQRGEELLRQGKYPEAHALFQEAVRLYGEEGEFHAYLGWSRFQMDPRNAAAVEEALESLERAVHLNPRIDKTYLFTGYVYKATGRSELAERQFEKAIQANPACVEALHELSLLSWASRLGSGKK